MKNLLCCNSIGEGEEWFDAPFFPAVFKSAGYGVYLWDNQKTFNANADYSFTLNSFLYNPEFDKIAYTATNDTSYQYDGQIVEDFTKNVKMKAAHNLVIFHLMGQHNIQHKRYPHIPLFDHFTADSIRKKANYLDKEKKQMIAEYDNSTLYNDYVIDQIIHLFENKNTILFYLSDHGEEVFDFRNRIGREHGPLFDKKLFFEYQVPCMVWCSDTFIQNHPETINAIKKAEDKPLMSDILFNTLFNVGGIQTDLYRPEDDVLHPSYQTRKRIIEGQLDYDKEMQGKRFDDLYKWQ
jgi:heptose-I-phosphate ethanolaminephosphotransferase